MTTEIVFNGPGDGEWIMERAEGRFNPLLEHSIANYRSGAIVGGFVLASYLGHSAAVHVAGAGPGWCTRRLLVVMSRYAFWQLRCGKLFAPVQSDNYAALAQDLRAGFCLETVVRDAYAPGRHLMLLAMTPATCPWLKLPLQ